MPRLLVSHFPGKTRTFSEAALLLRLPRDFEFCEFLSYDTFYCIKTEPVIRLDFSTVLTFTTKISYNKELSHSSAVPWRLGDVFPAHWRGLISWSSMGRGRFCCSPLQPRQCTGFPSSRDFRGAPTLTGVTLFFIDCSLYTTGRS